MNIEQIKEEARRLESYEAWSEALELYQSAITQTTAAGESDPSLFSRAGDLHLRLQRPEAAAECYESAVDLFARDDNLDSAFAVCQKILRHLPDREQVYLKVARIRAAQGFPEYARQHYLTYAKMRGDQGDRAEAVRVLEELVGVAPGDLETRVFLADRLAVEGRPIDALAHLHEGYRRGLAGRDRKGLERVRERIYALDPASARSGLFGPMPDDASTNEESAGAEATGARKSGPLSRLLSAFRRRGQRDVGASDPESGQVAAPAFLPSWARDPEPAREPAVEERAEPQAVEERIEPQAADKPEAVEERVEQAFEVWLEPQAAAPEAEPIARVEPSLAPSDSTVERRRPSRLEPEYVSSDELATVDGSARTREQEEAEVLALLAAEPHVVAHHERFVRHAARVGDPALLLDGLFHMAMALRAAGLEWRAKSTLARILSMDPSNELALEALGYRAGAPFADPFIGAPREPVARPEPTPLQPAAATQAGQAKDRGIPETGFVDLAALIFDEPVDTTTRWQVAAKAPAQNGDDDFALVLSQFKDKVSHHLEHSDARAHYELGSAYREMGLLGEAIGMFQEALRAEPDFLPATEMLGRTFLDKGDVTAAIKVLRREPAVRVAVEDDLIGIYYYLGNAYELMGNRDAAKDYYMRVFAMDINFIDVTERLRALR